MAAVTNTYKVSYYFSQNGKKSSQDYSDYIQATAGDYNTIKTVLTNNSRLRLGTLEITSVQEVGHGEIAIA